MSSKILKKRSNSESTEQSPPKKQKKELPKKTESANETKLNGDGKAEVLNAKQRKREKTKNRKLAAIARIKEEGGIPKALWAGRKERKAAAVAVKESDNPQNGEDDVKVSKKKLNENKNKNRTVEEKLKAKQQEREEIKKLRKEKRQQDGQYKPEQITLTADEIRLRITEIKGRGELTKTARRKLGVFIKKLAILEGTAVKNETNKNNDNDDDDEEKGNLSESSKRRLRREKKGLNGNKEDGEEDDDDSIDDEKEKPVNIQLFEKKKKQQQQQKVVIKKIDNKVQEAKLGEQKNNKQINKQQNSIKTNNKIIKKEIVKAEPSDDDDEEEEDEDEEEDDVEDEVAEPDNGEEDENEEDSDDEEEEEEDDEELNSSQQDAEEEDAGVQTVKKTVKKVEGKVKKEQGKGAKKQSDQDQNSEKKKRYILFVGNIPFEAKQEDLKKHFLTKVGEVSSVRIPTKPGTQVPRGFGYVEVTNDIDYEKALSLHHTMLNGRRINVEYTLSGSKKVNNRKELVSKNQKLHALRKAGKLAGSQKHDQKRSVRRYKKKENERQSK